MGIYENDHATNTNMTTTSQKTDKPKSPGKQQYTDPRPSLFPLHHREGQKEKRKSNKNAKKNQENTKHHQNKNNTENKNITSHMPKQDQNHINQKHIKNPIRKKYPNRNTKTTNYYSNTIIMNR